MTENDAAYTLRRKWQRGRSRKTADAMLKEGRVNPKTFTFRMAGVPGYVLFPYQNMRVARIQ